MPGWFRWLWTRVKGAFDLFNRTKAPRLAAALAFYVVLSLAPLLVLVISLAGLMFGEEAARGGVQREISGLIGPQGAEAVQTMLASQTKEGGVLSTIIGLVTLLVGATGVFAQLQDALNTVWEVPDRKTEGLGLWKMVRDRLLSFSVVAGLAFLLLMSLVGNALLSALSGWVRSHLGDASILIYVGDVVLSLLLSAAMFAVVFKVLPDRRVSWRGALIGAGFTALLFNAGKYLIGLYLGTAAVGSAFGAAGSLVVLLVWVYYSSHILLFGAAFTRVASEPRASAETKPQGQPAFAGV
jgi:membrane protein